VPDIVVDSYVPPAFEFLYRPAPFKAAHGGRGSAKSHSFAGALIDLGTQDAFRAVCCREIQRSIKDSSKRLLDDKIAKKNLGYGPGGAKFYYSTDSYIRGENGTLFLFEGLRGTASAVRSFEGVRYAWVDESQDVSQASLDTLLPTIREGETELWFSWNPKLPKNPVDKMFRGGEPPPGSIVREINYPDNPFFPDSLRRLMEWDRARDPDKYQHIWLGGYERNSEARVFKNWRIASRGELRPLDGDINSSLFASVPRGTVPRHGADWGFAVSPTVLVRCYIVGRTLYIDRELYAVGMPIDATPDFFATMPGTRNTDGGPAWLIVADSARPETIDYVRRRGFNIVAANKGPNSIREGVEFLKTFDIVVSPDCPQTIDELSLYSFKVDKLTQAVLPELEDKKNNVIDSLRYAVEQDRKTQTRQLRINLMGR
jgi:phage terminase large subunit